MKMNHFFVLNFNIMLKKLKNNLFFRLENLHVFTVQEKSVSNL